MLFYAYRRVGTLCLRPEHFPIVGLQKLPGRCPATGQKVGNSFALQKRKQTLLPVRGAVRAALQPGKYCSDCLLSFNASKRLRVSVGAGPGVDNQGLEGPAIRDFQSGHGRGTYDSITLPLLFLWGCNFIVENGNPKGIYFKASEEERNLIEQKIALAGVRNVSGNLRKIAIDGYVINLEIPELTGCENCCAASPTTSIRWRRQ